jgi:hypothetical protein
MDQHDTTDAHRGVNGDLGVSDLPGFEGWTIVAPAPETPTALPMLVSPDGRAAVRLDMAEAMSQYWHPRHGDGEPIGGH